MVCGQLTPQREQTFTMLALADHTRYFVKACVKAYGRHTSHPGLV